VPGNGDHDEPEFVEVQVLFVSLKLTFVTVEPFA
jgi:hypothetical protein